MLSNQDKLIISDIELFSLFYPEAFIIGVTGTVGKTTTVLLLEHLLKKKCRVQIGGNIGIPIFDLNDEFNFKDEILIIECSSYMLANIKTFHPHIMIITNIYENHLDHHITYDHYLKSKLNSLKNMNINDYLVTTKELEDVITKQNVNKNYINQESIKVIGNRLYYKDILLVEDYTLNINGKHNIINLLLCLKVCDILKVKLDVNILDDFKLPLYRLSKIYDDKIIIYNDSKSTNFYSLISAIETLESKELPIHWIGGGLDRNEDWLLLRDIFTKISMAYVYGENRNKIATMLENIGVPFLCYEKLDDVINNLINLNNKIILLFSPGSPSTDQFKDYVERGKYFEKLILNKLKNLQL